MQTTFGGLLEKFEGNSARAAQILGENRIQLSGVFLSAPASTTVFFDFGSDRQIIGLKSGQGERVASLRTGQQVTFTCDSADYVGGRLLLNDCSIN